MHSNVPRPAHPRRWRAGLGPGSTAPATGCESPPGESPVTSLTAECAARKLLANCLLPAALPAWLPQLLRLQTLAGPAFFPGDYSEEML